MSFKIARLVGLVVLLAVIAVTSSGCPRTLVRAAVETSVDAR